MNLRELCVIGGDRAEIVSRDRSDRVKERLHIADVIIDARAYEPGKGKGMIESRARVMASLFLGKMQIERYEGNCRDPHQEDESSVYTTIEGNHPHRSLSVAG